MGAARTVADLLAELNNLAVFTIAIVIIVLGKAVVSKLDEFLENLQTAFVPAPFMGKYNAIFPEIHDQNSR